MTKQNEHGKAIERDRPALDIVITDEMVRAGVWELRDKVFGRDLNEVVRSVYLAMEIERMS